MHTSVILLRGINVGGKQKLLMRDLKTLLETFKLQNVRTYIQSGNVVAESARRPATKLANEISRAIETSHGFAPAVLILDFSDVENAIDNNPFPDATAHPQTLHVFFLSKPAKSPNVEAIEQASSSSERYELTENVFYLWAPDGIARSKLAANAERFLGVPTTSRNWRTVLKLKEMSAAKS